MDENEIDGFVDWQTFDHPELGPVELGGWNWIYALKNRIAETNTLERLEQLRALEHGIPILVLDAPHPSYGVDTPEDLRRVEEMMRHKN